MNINITINQKPKIEQNIIHIINVISIIKKYIEMRI